MNNWSRLRLVTPPSDPVMLLEDAKQHLRVSDDDDDTQITQMIEGVRAGLEGPMGWGIALMPQTWALRLDAFCSEIEIPITPVASITSITYVDTAGATQTLSSALYQVDAYTAPARIAPVYGSVWPGTKAVLNAVTVTFVAGYASRDDLASRSPDLLQAIKAMLLLRYSRVPDMEAVIDSYRNRHAVVALA